MKKLLLAILLVILTSCAGKMDYYLSEDGKTWKTEGWRDENTFVVATEGTWPRDKNFDTNMQKRAMARESALVQAQKRIVEKFYGYTLSGESNDINAQMSKVDIKKKFEAIIRGGTLLSVRYTPENDASIVYSISGANLKKKLESAIGRSIK